MSSWWSSSTPPAQAVAATPLSPAEIAAFSTALKAIDDSFFSWDKFAWRKAPPDVVWPLVAVRRIACREIQFAEHGCQFVGRRRNAPR